VESTTVIPGSARDDGCGAREDFSTFSTSGDMTMAIALQGAGVRTDNQRKQR
jgi:hypothetical protein